MRVIGGSARGRRLQGPPSGAATRPTSDKVREALFNVLGPRVQGARVLDAFAGTGALGIEALSRGAAHATFVEASRALCETIGKNLAAAGFADRATVLCRDVRRAGAALGREPYDLVLIDPPYGLGLEAAAVEVLLRGELLAPGARVVIEHARKAEPALPEGAAAVLVAEPVRPYGDTALTVYRAGGDTEPEADADAGAQDEVAAVSEETTAMTRTAVYPGSFDPLTNGHLDVIQRSLHMFDKLVIAVASNVRKQPLFPVEERITLIREVVGDDPRIEIDTFDGLLVEYAKRKGAVALVRGLRAVADFEYEFEMASMNRRLAPNVETVFLMTHENYFYVSSHLVKEVASLGGDVEAFVPPAIAARLKVRMPRK
jgi:pantetheine-phosphate adenylyltransferase